MATKSIEHQDADSGLFVAKPVRHFGRRVSSYAREIPGGLFANVRDGRIVGVGIEPIGDVVVERDGRVVGLESSWHRARPARLVWVAPLAGAAAGAVATGIAWRRHARAA